VINKNEPHNAAVLRTQRLRKLIAKAKKQRVAIGCRQNREWENESSNMRIVFPDENFILRSLQNKT
jgi:hypothetical protein